MKSADLTIHIPAAIAVLHLSLAEKVALATIANRPGISNASLARSVCMSVRGVEVMLARLRKRGLLVQIVSGHDREHRLTLPSASHTKCEKTANADSNTLCGPDVSVPPDPMLPVPTQSTLPARKEQSLEDAVEEDVMSAKKYILIGSFEPALEYYHRAKQRIQADPDLTEEGKRNGLAIITGLENRAVALRLALEAAAAKGLSRGKANALVAATMKLSPEKLAQIRQRVDAQAELGDALDILALPSI